MRLAEQARFLVLAAQTEGRRQLSQQLRPLGLTPSQAEVLRLIQDHGPTTLREIGRLLVCESGTSPSRLVARVVSQGLVDRRPSKTDRREIQLTLTDAGLRVCAEIATIEETMYAAIDSIAQGDMEPAVAFLRRFIEGSPSGEAFERRLATGPE